MNARMLDSGKLNPPTVIVPLLLDDGEPPPEAPQALAMRLSPRIEDSRARYAHRDIAVLLSCSGARAGLDSCLIRGPVACRRSCRCLRYPTGQPPEGLRTAVGRRARPRGPPPSGPGAPGARRP